MLIIYAIFLLVMFLGGMYFYAKYSDPKILETLQNNTKPRCPNLLIQFGSKFYLYNSNVKKVPGVNPIEFNNLEDYTDFLKWQNTVGIKCPVLYLQNTYDAQGNRVYKIRPSVTEPQGGLPPSVSNNSNTNHVNNINTLSAALIKTMPDIMKPDDDDDDKPKIDLKQFNIQYPDYLAPIVPVFKTLDDDPMNHNWGGKQHTEKSVSEGKYADREVLFY
jgi:hypothetical protein